MTKKKQDSSPEEPGIKAQLKQRIKELKTRKMLPHGYGKMVVAIVLQRAKEAGREVKCTENNVNQVMSGNSLRLDIVEALIELAENSKEKLMLDRINKLLEK